MLAGAPLEHDGNCQSEEEQNAEEDQHEVQVQWRIDLRDVGKKKRAGQKENGLLNAPLAEPELCCGPRETAGGTLIRDARSATVKTAGHAVEYTVRFKAASAKAWR